MKFTRVLLGYGVILALYLIILWTSDVGGRISEYIPVLLNQFPILISMALISYGLRYFRWYLFLKWSGNSSPIIGGLLAYLSGFALTATPGKVGELLRIRYFGRLGVSADRVFSAFVFERVLDLIIVFGLSSLSITSGGLFWVVCYFISLVLIFFIIFTIFPEAISHIGVFLLHKKLYKFSRLFDFFTNVFLGCRSWFKFGPILIGLLVGVLAWSITSFTFVYLLSQLNIKIPWLAAFSTYPMAMLAGAASMLPGGVGSTEAAIVFQLKWFGIDAALAFFVAVIIRLSTIWLSVLLGFFSIIIQEYLHTRN